RARPAPLALRRAGRGGAPPPPPAAARSPQLAATTPEWIQRTHQKGTTHDADISSSLAPQLSRLPTRSLLLVVAAARRCRARRRGLAVGEPARQDLELAQRAGREG